MWPVAGLYPMPDGGLDCGASDCAGTSTVVEQIEREANARKATRIAYVCGDKCRRERATSGAERGPAHRHGAEQLGRLHRRVQQARRTPAQEVLRLYVEQ